MKRKVMINKVKGILSDLRKLKHSSSDEDEELGVSEEPKEPRREKHPGESATEAPGSAHDRLSSYLENDSPNKGRKKREQEGIEEDNEEEEEKKPKRLKKRDPQSKKHKAPSGDALERLEELIEEEGTEEEGTEEEEEEVEKKGRKTSKLVGKERKQQALTQPSTKTTSKSLATSPNPTTQNKTLEEIQQDMERFLNEMPSDKKEMEHTITSYLGKLKYLALRKAERLLVKLIDVSPSELVKLATALTDMQLTVKWTKKLEKAILENPSKLKRPGSGAGWSLLSRVQEMAKSTKMEQNRDGRQSGIKKANHLEMGLDVPQDDAPMSKAGGA